MRSGKPAEISATPLARKRTFSLSKHAKGYLADSRAKGHSRATLAYRRVYLGQFLTWLGERKIKKVREITPGLLHEYLVFLKGRKTAYKRARPTSLSPRTLAAEVSVLRSFFSWLTDRRILLFNPSEGLRLGKTSGGLPRPILSYSEVEALLSAPGTDPLGLRDRAILETLYSTALRRAELCGLDLYDLDSAGEVVQVRGGKGGRDRIVPIGKWALEAVSRYLHESRPNLAGTPKETALFLAANTRKRLSVKTLNLIVRKYAAAAKIGKRVTPHLIRHTCATHLLQNGADIRHIQEILGHSVVTTTQIYTRIEINNLCAVHRRKHPRKDLTRSPF